MTRTPHQPIRVFVSYSHKDWRHRDRLRTSLRGLRRQGLIEDWQDQDITPGAEWAAAIDENLKTADVIILLVSPDFVDSDYAYYKEMQRALERHERGEAVVIPIIARPTDWEEEPFSKLEVLPTKGRPIIEWSVRDRAWLDVAKGIRKAVKELSLKRQEQADKERYREAVEQAWTDEKLSSEETERLNTLARELGLSTDTAADIERQVMGDRKEPILERQERAAREKERKKQLHRLYARASRLHQDEEWQAVVDVFAQIHSEDPAYQDPEGLLASAHEALETARKEEEAFRQYHEAVETAWQDGELHGREVERLRYLANELELIPSKTAEIEREVMSDTLEAILERQQTARKRYREAVEAAWADNRVSDAEAERLGALASELGLITDAAADVERDIMGATKEAILERQERAAREEERKEQSVFPDRVLLATDGADDTARATEAAVDLSNKSGSELHLVHVWHDVPDFAHSFVRRELKRQGQEILDEQVRTIQASGGAVTKAHLRGGQTSDEIIELSEKLGVGLLVLGGQAIGKVKRTLIGSHSEEIVHHAHVPVLVVRPGKTWPPARLIVGEDFSDDAKRAGEIAASIGALYGSQVLFVYAQDLSEIPSGKAGPALDRYLRDWRKQVEEKLQSRFEELEGILGSRPEIMLSAGAPAAVLLEEAQRDISPALIAVGRRGLAGITRTGLGSVSEKIVTAAQGPVLISPT